MTGKVLAAIIGPGNIGTDLLAKLRRSDVIEVGYVVGVVESDCIKRAREMGIPASADGLDWLLAHAAAPIRPAVIVMALLFALILMCVGFARAGNGLSVLASVRLAVLGDCERSCRTLPKVAFSFRCRRLCSRHICCQCYLGGALPGELSCSHCSPTAQPLGQGLIFQDLADS